MPDIEEQPTEASEQTRERETVQIEVKDVAASGLIGSIVIWTAFVFLQSYLGAGTWNISGGVRGAVSLFFFIEGYGLLMWCRSALATATAEAPVVTSGPYALVRHPMYGIIMWNGTFIVSAIFQSWIVFLALPILWAWWTWLCRLEEMSIVNLVGTEYTNYAKYVGRLIPGSVAPAPKHKKK